MKRVNFFLACLLLSATAVSCMKDYEDINIQINHIGYGNGQTTGGDSLAITSMSFLSEYNASYIDRDVYCNIIGDSVIDGWIPNIVYDKHLRADIVHTGHTLYVNGEKAEDGVVEADFSKPVELTIDNGISTKKYVVYVHSFTGLPVMWIETEGRKDIVSKDEYLSASFRLQEDVLTRAAGDVIDGTVSIRGRGNSSWAAMPKKPYRLKFDAKVSLLDEPADKSWVLLNNYADKTMLRNSIAFFMGKISNLDYTPHSHFVELILNGRYNGTYLLCDHLKISKHRVNVGDDGFLLEIDKKAAEDEPTFTTEHLEFPVNIKDPDVEVGDDDYLYVRDYVIAAEKALFSDDFRNPQTGWQKYMDMDSFVDWYLINEITMNPDAFLNTSCFMNMERGGKLKMGPLWDFDIAFSNNTYIGSRYDGFYIKYSSWFARLFKDEAFVSRVKERFAYFYSQEEEIMREINADTAYLRYAVQENENRWHTFYTATWQSNDIWGSYDNEIYNLKQWIANRFEWLKTEFDKM